MPEDVAQYFKCYGKFDFRETFKKALESSACRDVNNLEAFLPEKVRDCPSDAVQTIVRVFKILAGRKSSR